MSKGIPTGLTVAFLILLGGSLIAACATGQQQVDTPDTQAPTPTEAPASEELLPALDGQALVQERCTECHNLGRVERARKTEAGWKANVERMVKMGAQLSQKEQTAVIQYLAETYPQ